MNVNVTLFVQIGNFVITYFFLRHVFLKPFAQFILQREKERTQAAYDIASKEATIAQIHYERQTRWEHFRNYCKVNVPNKELSGKYIDKSPFFHESQEVDAFTEITKKDIIEKAGQLTFLIVKTVKNRGIQ